MQPVPGQPHARFDLWAVPALLIFFLIIGFAVAARTSDPLMSIQAWTFMAGIGGAYLSTIYTPLWAEGMTAGRGWIALALVVFATWRPGRVLLGAYLFGGVTLLQFYAQGAGVAIEAQLLSSLPYLATILVLILISRNPDLIRRNAPIALGKTYHPEGP